MEIISEFVYQDINMDPIIRYDGREVSNRGESAVQTRSCNSLFDSESFFLHNRGRNAGSSSPTDNYMISCCTILHKSINRKLARGYDPAVLQEQKYLQFALYEIMCGELDSDRDVRRVKVDYALPVMHIFRHGANNREAAAAASKVNITIVGREMMEEKSRALSKVNPGTISTHLAGDDRSLTQTSTAVTNKEDAQGSTTNGEGVGATDRSMGLLLATELKLPNAPADQKMSDILRLGFLQNYAIPALPERQNVGTSTATTEFNPSVAAASAGMPAAKESPPPMNRTYGAESAFFVSCGATEDLINEVLLPEEFKFTKEQMQHFVKKEDYLARIPYHFRSVLLLDTTALGRAFSVRVWKIVAWRDGETAIVPSAPTSVVRIPSFTEAGSLTAPPLPAPAESGQCIITTATAAAAAAAAAEGSDSTSGKEENRFVLKSSSKEASVEHESSTSSTLPPEPTGKSEEEVQSKDGATTEDETSDLHLFKVAVNALTRHKPSVDLNNQQKLDFYAWFKQVEVGPCNTPVPSMFDPVGRSKHDAWKQLGNMSADEARKKYVRLALEVYKGNLPPIESKDQDSVKNGGSASKPIIQARLRKH